MSRRVAAAFASAAVVLLALTGCQAQPTGFGRPQAQSDAAAWTTEAVHAAGAPTTTTRSDGYETCRTDTGFFTSTFQWRTITWLAIPSSTQPAATRAIRAAFTDDGWAAQKSTGVASLVVLAGPRDADRRGVVRIETGGPAELSVTVISPCYG
jgi:hypothetical protein